MSILQNGGLVSDRPLGYVHQAERHVLLINGEGQRRAIALEAAAYSVGRDQTNAIVLDSDTVSRQHAILLRVPVPETNSYRYRLVDGNAEGKASTNGVFVNGQRCSFHSLSNGDVITFGRKLTASYLVLSMDDAEFADYLESISYQSIKSGLLNPKETLVSSEGADPMPELASAGLTKLRQTEECPSRRTIHETVQLERRAWLKFVAAIVVLGIAAGGGAFWLLSAQRASAPPQPTPAVLKDS